ncbi:major facilitator superfamily transporter [Seiridium cupressi]
MGRSHGSKYNSMDFSGTVLLIASDGRKLLLPIPSKSPHDPLGWSTGKRVLAFISLIEFYIVAQVLVLAPEFLLQSFESDPTLTDREPFSLATTMTVPTLTLGIGGFIWLPLSLVLGRKPVLVFCNVLLALGTVWAAAAPNFYHLLAAICTQGLAAGSVFSLMISIIIDMTFIQERPQAIAMFWGIGGGVSTAISSMVPLLSRGDDRSWSRFYWAWSIACVISVVTTLIFVSETFYVRPPVAYDGRVLVQNGHEKVNIYEDWEQVPGGKILPGLPQRPDKQRSCHFLAGSRLGSWKDMAACYPQTMLCLCNPRIFWVMLLNAANFAGMMSIGTTFPILLRSPPYNFQSQTIALVNLAAAVGSFVAWPAAGPLVQSISYRLTRRNQGIRHAEYYLPAFILPVVASAASCILYGITAENKLHWILVYVSYFLNSFAYSASGVANTLWVTEALPRWAAPGLIVVGGVSYIISVSMSFSIQPWLDSQGFTMMNIEIAIGILLIGIIGVPVAFWGKGVRQHMNGRWRAFEAGALRPQ